MIAETFVYICAVFGVVAGSCIEIKAPQDYSSSQVISIPMQAESSFSSPVVPENVFTSGPSSFASCDGDGPIMPAPVVTENIFSSGCSPSSPVYAPSLAPSENDYSSGSYVPIPVSSRSSFSEIFSIGQSGSSPGSSFEAEPTSGAESASVFQAPVITLPAVEGPVVTFSSQSIPAPRVLSQRCICTKTIVKPQIYQRIVTVPKIQRYLKRTVTPVIENVSYKSTPITQESSSGSGSFDISGSSGSSSFILSGSGSSSSPVFFSSGSSSTPMVFSSGSCGSQSRYVSPPVVVSPSSCPKIC